MKIDAIGMGLVQASATKVPAVKSGDVVGTNQTQKGGDGSIWSELGAQVNVHAATKEDMAAVSQHLYDTGNISLKVHAMLSFDPTLIPGDVSGYLTQSDNAGNRDWLVEFQQRRDLAKKLGDEESVKNIDKAIVVLEKLDKGGDSGVSLKA